MSHLEHDLLSLNYRLTAKALSLWNGNPLDKSAQNPCDGFSHILTRDTVQGLRPEKAWTKASHRTFHTLLGHYLQYHIAPFESELFTWMRGAAAHVNGEKIYFRNILSWCQKRSNLADRRIVEKESSSICRFLKPFSIGLWDFLLELLREEFGYETYVEYCSEKKQIDYRTYLPTLDLILEQTDALYFEKMEDWTQRSLGAPLRELNRFDAIYMLGLGEFDKHFSGEVALKNHLEFFESWGIKLRQLPGLFLDIDASDKKSGQAMTFALKIPDEIHLLMNPQGGWVDLETLFHEMGHALSHVFTSPQLPPADKDFFTSNTLSETYAFLVQNICFSPPFLERQLGLTSKAIEEMRFYKALKDLSVFRRYVSKFLAEYEVFGKNDVGNGEPYAALLKEHTGFSYLPETHLFDLVPEFYSLDYVVSWMAEATMEKAMVTALGDEWMFKREAGEALKEWWVLGNQYDLDELFTMKGIGPVDPRDIVKRWHNRITAGANLD